MAKVLRVLSGGAFRTMSGGSAITAARISPIWMAMVASSETERSRRPASGRKPFGSGCKDGAADSLVISA
jgi:hypothetical protein